MAIDYANWMQNLDDDMQLSQLSIPGTHNSAACYIGLPSVRCQDSNVKKQLENGTRFLDIRLGKPLLTTNTKDLSDLQVVHGMFPVKLPLPLHFSSVLEEIIKYLDNHSKECVVLSVKQEGFHSWDNERNEFADDFYSRYVSENPERWYLENNPPKLGEVRGKIILFRRFGVHDGERSQKFGIDGAWWPYNSTSEDRGSFQVQDFCEVNHASDVVKKAGYVKDLIDNACAYNSTNPEASKMFINFCSGSNLRNPDCWPKSVAQKMARCDVYHNIKKGCGILVVDYAGMNSFEFPHRIVECNF